MALAWPRAGALLSDRSSAVSLMTSFAVTRNSRTGMGRLHRPVYRWVSWAEGTLGALTSHGRRRGAAGVHVHIK